MIFADRAVRMGARGVEVAQRNPAQAVRALDMPSARSTASFVSPYALIGCGRCAIRRSVTAAGSP